MTSKDIQQLKNTVDVTTIEDLIYKWHKFRDTKEELTTSSVYEGEEYVDDFTGMESRRDVYYQNIDQNCRYVLKFEMLKDATTAQFAKLVLTYPHTKDIIQKIEQLEINGSFPDIRGARKHAEAVLERMLGALENIKNIVAENGD